MARFGGWRPLQERRRWRLASLVAIVSIILLGLLGGDPALAKSLYKYQDASGAWVFTDRPPENASIPVEVKQLPVSELPARVSIRNRGTTDAPALTVINDYYGPIEVEISGEGIENMEIRPPLPVRVVAPARTETPVVTLRPTGRRWRYGYQVRAVLGDPAATHQPDRPYTPPFAPGQQFLIGQAFDGTFSHQHPQSRYAVDISLPLGTPVRAAREGVIMEFAADFLDGGPDQKYREKANAVRVLHTDGTMAVYAHLQADSVRVRPGQRIERGTWLANSGNSGFSTGPHLHFAIQRNAGMELVSVPFEFAGPGGRGITPVTGMLLAAP